MKWGTTVFSQGQKECKKAEAEHSGLPTAPSSQQVIVAPLPSGGTLWSNGALHRVIVLPQVIHDKVWRPYWPRLRDATSIWWVEARDASTWATHNMFSSSKGSSDPNGRIRYPIKGHFTNNLVLELKSLVGKKKLSFCENLFAFKMKRTICKGETERWTWRYSNLVSRPKPPSRQLPCSCCSPLLFPRALWLPAQGKQLISLHL